MYEAKERLSSLMYEKWYTEIQTVPKLRFFNLFKENYETKWFVKCIQNRKKRSILAQFRYSILPLSIETGRFQDIPIEYRYCLFCDDNLIESEYHFILHCTFYNELRFDFFNRVRQIDFNFD